MVFSLGALYLVVESGNQGRTRSTGECPIVTITALMNWEDQGKSFYHVMLLWGSW